MVNILYGTQFRAKYTRMKQPVKSKLLPLSVRILKIGLILAENPFVRAQNSQKNILFVNEDDYCKKVYILAELNS